MKRKYILIGFAALLSAAACEPSHLEDNLYDPSVYILNNGYQKTSTFYDVQSSFSAEVNAYCGSYYEQNPQVKLSEDAAVLENTTRRTRCLSRLFLRTVGHWSRRSSR